MSAGEFDIYLDGLLLEEVILADDVLFTFDQTTNWYLGAVNDTLDARPSNPFDWTLDEIKIYGSTLTAEEIADEAAEGDVDDFECPDRDEDDPDVDD